MRLPLAARILSAYLSATFLLTTLRIDALAASTGNLSSTQASTAATTAGTIRVGNRNVAVQPGQMLTPAETFALNQVLQTGHQTLVLGALGNAVRGSLSINGITGQSLTDLVIPHGVRVMDNVALTQLSLPGGLTNSGALYVFSTSSSTATALLNATDIINQKGGLLSTIVPTNLLRGQSAIPSLNLDLTALNNIINAGTISSSGGITLTAGNTITNSGTVSANGAGGSVSLISNSFTNSGLVSSALSDININAANTGNIAVNNINGTLQALLGNINVRDASFTAKSNFDLTGGNVLSQALNINTGNGTSAVDVNKITGLVNINAGISNLLASTPDLKVGTLNLTGDPTFYNLTGSITITTFPASLSGADVAIVANKDITTGSGFTGINTSSTTAKGGDITLVAGANIQVLSGGSGGGSGTTTDQDPVQLQINGASATGGKIVLTGAIAGATAVTLDAHSTSGNGGNVNLIAFSGTESGSGGIALGTPDVVNSKNQITAQATGVDINSAGSAGHSNGNVTVIGGGNIYLGNITASGAGSGGNIEIVSALPAFSNGTNSPPSSIQITNGAVQAGVTFAPGAVGVGSITLSGVNAPGGATSDGSVTIATGGSITTQALSSKTTNSNGNGIELDAGGGMVLNGALNATTGNINLTATTGSILYGGNIVATAGNVTMNAGGAIEGLNHSTATISADHTIPGSTSGWKFLLGAVVDNIGLDINTNHFVFVPDFTNNTVSVIDTNLSPNKQVANISTTGFGNFSAPEGMTLSPDGKTLYVANSGNGTISVVDVTTQAVTSVITVGGRPESVALNPAGTVLYVVNNSSIAGFNQAEATTLTIIPNPNGASPTPINMPVMIGTKQATATSQTGAVVVNPQGNLLFFSASGSKQIVIYNISNPTSPTFDKAVAMTSTVFKKEVPIFMALDPTGTRLFVSEGFANLPTGGHTVQGSIAQIDVLQNSPTFGVILGVASMPTATGGGSFPQGIAVNATGTELFSQSTYLPYTFSTYTGLNQTVEFIPVIPNAGPDGYGSNSFATVTNNGGVPQTTFYASNTQNLQGENTVSVIQKPTVMSGPGGTIKMTAAGGDILANVDSQGGTLLINSTGTGAVVVNDLGSGGATIGASSAPKNFFQIGSTESLILAGAINSPSVLIQTTDPTGGPASNITINNTIGQSAGTLQFRTGAGDILLGSNGSVVAKSISMTSVTGNIDTAASFTHSDTGNVIVDSGTNVETFDVTSTGHGPIRLDSVTVGGVTKNEGTDFTFNDTTGVITWTGFQPLPTDSVIAISRVPFQVTTNALTAVTGGDVHINNNAIGTLTLEGAAAGNQFVLQSPAAITMPTGIGVISSAVDLRAGGAITIGNQIGNSTTPGVINLQAGGTGGITQAKGTFDIVGTTLTMAAGSGGIGSSTSNLRTDITSTLGSATVAGSGSKASIFIDNTAAGNTTLTVGSTAPTPILNPNPQSIAAFGTFSLKTSGNIIDPNDNIANVTTLILNTPGSIGTLGFGSHAFLTSASSITVNGGNDVSLGALAPASNFGTYNVTVNKSSALDTFSLFTAPGVFNSTGNIIVAGVINSPNVDLTTTKDTAGTVTLKANVGQAAGGTTSISTDAVTQTVKGNDVIGNAIISAGGTILSSVIDLSTAYGNIGTSAAPIKVTAPGSGTTMTVSAGNTPPLGATGNPNAFLKVTGDLTLKADGTGDIGNTNPINVSMSKNATLTLQAPTGSAFVNVTSGTVLLAGVSNVKDTLSISNPGGALSVGGSANTFGVFPTNLMLDAKTNLTYTNADLTSKPLNSLSLFTFGTLTLPVSSLTMAPAANGDGGFIKINAATLKFTGGTMLTLDTDAAASTNGTGGHIVMDITGSQAYNISSTASPTTPTLDLEAAPATTGADSTSKGGSISVTFGGKITADQTGINNRPTTLSGAAGGITFVQSNNALTFTGNLSTAGDGAGAGATLTLEANNNLNITGNVNAGTQSVILLAKGSTPFQVGGTVTSNGIAGTINGGSVQVSNLSGINVNTAPTTNGTLEFDTSKLVNNTSLSGEVGLNINGESGSVTVSNGTGTVAWGSPTDVNIFAGANITTGPLFTGTTFVGATAPTNITIQGKGTLTLGFSSLATNPAGNTALTAGSINISGSSIKFNDTNLHTFTAGNQNSDGSVSITQTGTAAVNVGNAPGNIEIDIQSTAATTNGGSILVKSGGVLTVDAANGLLTDSPTTSTNLSLTSGGALLVNGFTQNLVGTAGNLTFGSKSANPFTIATGATNGINASLALPLQAANLSIRNSGGSIGTATALAVNATGLVLVAGSTGTVNVSDSATTISLFGSSSAKSFTLTAAAATVTQTAGTITAPTLALNLGSITGTVNINSTTISGGAALGAGKLTLNDSTKSPVKIGPITAGNGITLTTLGTITTVGSLSAPSITLTGVGNLVIGGNIGDSTAGGSDIKLTAGGTGSITQTSSAFLIMGDAVTLSAGGSIGTTTTNIQTTANSIDAAAGIGNTNVFINNTSPTLAVTNGLADKTFQIKSTGDINITGSITFASNVVLNSTGGNVDIGAPIGFDGDGFFSNGGVVTVTGKTITDTSAQGLIRGQTVTLNASTGDIGTNSKNVLTTAINLVANAPSGNAFIGALSPAAFLFPYTVNVGKSTVSAGGTFNVDTQINTLTASTPNDSSIQVVGAITAGNITLSAGAGTNGNILISVPMTTAGTATLTAEGAGNITTSGTGVVTASNVILTAGAGSIGTATAPFKTTVTSSPGTLAANSTGGNVFLSNTSSSALILGNSSSGGSFSLTDSSPSLTISGTVATNAQPTSNLGNLTISEITGTSLIINNTLTANGGSVVVQDVPATGQISVNANISTNVTGTQFSGNGAVTICVGAIPTATGPAVTPTSNIHVTGSGGTAFAGANPSQVQGPAGGGQFATLNLLGANIQFNVVTAGSGGIQLGNGITITADPSVPNKPIGFTTQTNTPDEIIVDSGEDTAE